MDSAAWRGHATHPVAPIYIPAPRSGNPPPSSCPLILRGGCRILLKIIEMHSISSITNSFNISVKGQGLTPEHHHALPVEVSSILSEYTC